LPAWYVRQRGQLIEEAFSLGRCLSVNDSTIADAVLLMDRAISAGMTVRAPFVLLRFHPERSKSSARAPSNKIMFSPRNTPVHLIMINDLYTFPARLDV
jgi:hypothetical protein